MRRVPGERQKYSDAPCASGAHWRWLRLRRPSLFAVALTLAGVIVFCALGDWQLQRAAGKDALLARFQHAASAAPVGLDAALAHPHADAWPHVRVSGHFDGEHVYLLDDRVQAGRLGVMAFVPFLPQGSSTWLLVNQGFLAKPTPGATALPELPPLPQGEAGLTGILTPPPRTGLRLGGNPLPQERAWPKLVTWIDPEQIAADLQRPVQSQVLLLDPDPHSAYLRIWTANVMPPARHRAYAVQWFTFALAAIVMFIVLHRVKPAPADRPDNEDTK